MGNYKEKNMFGKCLEQLLTITGVKNSLLAQELNYDASYICKWTTGKTIPSKKNIEKIIVTIGKVLDENATPEAKEEVQKNFVVEQNVDFQGAVAEILRNVYYDAIGELNTRLYVNNASFRALPRGEFPLLADLAKEILPEQKLKISVLADLFVMDNASKLQLAGIVEHHFALSKPRKDIQLDYILDISHLDGSNIYDIILLIHMMTNFSLTNFQLYHSPIANGKLMISVEEQFAGVSVLGENKQFLCTTTTRDSQTVRQVYDSIQSQINPDHKLFFDADMYELLKNYKYMQSLVSQEIKWLVGHLTEHFLSPQLFNALSKQYFPEEMQKELQRLHNLTVTVLKNNRVRIMLYSLSIMDFVLSGEVDFFNHKVILTPEQRREEVIYLKQLFMSMRPGCIKLVKEGFVDDFKYITNPCVFISESIQYLRLENKQYHNNLLVVKDDAIKRIINQFFDKIWSEDSKMIISEKEDVIGKLDNYIQVSSLFNENELND